MLVTHECDIMEEKGSDWLQKNLVVQYWKGVDDDETLTGDHHCSNLNRDW